MHRRTPAETMEMIEGRLAQHLPYLDYLITLMKPTDHKLYSCYEPEVNAGPCEVCCIHDLLVDVKTVLVAT